MQSPDRKSCVISIPATTRDPARQLCVPPILDIAISNAAVTDDFFVTEPAGSTSLVFHDPMTWANYIDNHGDQLVARNSFMSLFREHFHVTPRDAMARGAANDLWERVTLYETVEAWFMAAQRCDPDTWRKEYFLAMVMPSILRLHETVKVQPIGGATGVRKFRAEFTGASRPGDSILKATSKALGSGARDD